MNFESWISELKSLLTSSDSEAQEIIDYYKEIYGDKKDAGLSDQEILAEFGSPSECVAKIRESESASAVENSESGLGQKEQALQNSAPVSQNSDQTRTQKKEEQSEKSVTDEEVVGVLSKILIAIAMGFATLCIALPVFIGLYAATFSCIVSAGASAVAVVFSLLSVLSGGVVQWIASAGAYMAAFGVCTICGIFLFKASKFLTLWYVGLFKKLMGAKEEE